MNVKLLATLFAAVFYTTLIGVKLWPFLRRPVRRACAFCRRRVVDAVVAVLFSGLSFTAARRKARTETTARRENMEASRRANLKMRKRPLVGK